MATIKAFTGVEQYKDLQIFDGFDYLGNPTGIKCMVCLYQHIKCKYQKFFGEGAFLICKKYKEHSEFKCDKHEKLYRLRTVKKVGRDTAI